MIITISGGSYSDYWERWYTSEIVYTHQTLGEALQQVVNTLEWDDYECIKSEIEFDELMAQCGLKRLSPDLEVDSLMYLSNIRWKDDLERYVKGLLNG